jgi:hypothetical protein
MEGESNLTGSYSMEPLGLTRWIKRPAEFVEDQSRVPLQACRIFQLGLPRQRAKTQR